MEEMKPSNIESTSCSPFHEDPICILVSVLTGRVIPHKTGNDSFGLEVDVDYLRPIVGC